jgi:hypothetical protein
MPARKVIRKMHNKIERNHMKSYTIKRILLDDYVINVNSMNMKSHEDLKPSDEENLT